MWLGRRPRKIVGWGQRKPMPKGLVGQALRRIQAACGPAAGRVVRADQSSQYAAANFKLLLARHEPARSMGRWGCVCNYGLPGTTHAESFLSWFQPELLNLNDGSFVNLLEAGLWKPATSSPTKCPRISNRIKKNVIPSLPRNLARASGRRG